MSTSTERFAHHMSDEDALMWNIEKDPILRSTIVAVGIFDRVPDFDRLRRRIDRATSLHPAPAPARASPAVPDRAAALGARGRRSTSTSTSAACGSPRPATDRALLDVVQPIATSSFDRARPLWEFTLFEGLDGDGERAAFAMKVHHSVTDGVGGMALLAQLVDLDARRRRAGDAARSRTGARALEHGRRSCATRSRTPRGAWLGIARRVPVDARERARSRRCAIRRRRGRRGATPPARSAARSRPRRHRCRR